MSVKRGLQIDPRDNVGIVCEDVDIGDIVQFSNGTVEAREAIPMPHKIALKDMAENETVYKYGEIIGYTTKSIKVGAYVHVHNMDSEKLMK